ncbi:uncharacterized protein [Littorina saxatilis]|uniref:Uncharacterized protein n=1 Tax=Littorina saxatilis TaxID=31220 RepID=A0AAN9G053_9CAEN
MAGGGGDRLPVNCGVRLAGSSFVLSYKVGKNVEKKNIMWDWHSNGDKSVAKLEAKTKSGDIKFHNSAPIDADTHSKLGKPDKSMDGEYYTVKLKKKSSDVPDLEQFFNVPQ